MPPDGDKPEPLRWASSWRGGIEHSTLRLQVGETWHDVALLRKIDGRWLAQHTTEPPWGVWTSVRLPADATRAEAKDLLAHLARAARAEVLLHGEHVPRWCCAICHGQAFSLQTNAGYLMLTCAQCHKTCAVSLAGSSASQLLCGLRALPA